MPLYQPQNPLSRMPSGGGSQFSAAIQGKNQQAAMQPPDKTVGGALTNAMGGATTGLGAVQALGTMGVTMGAATGGIGLAVGAGLGLLSYALS